MRDRSLRQVAASLGLAVEEVGEQVRAGRSWCSCHADWLPVERFGSNRKRWNGLANNCRACNTARARRWREGYASAGTCRCDEEIGPRAEEDGPSEEMLARAIAIPRTHPREEAS